MYALCEDQVRGHENCDTVARLYIRLRTGIVRYFMQVFLTNLRHHEHHNFLAY